MGRRVAALFCWAYLVWVLLTWTLTLEQLLFGAAFALAVAVVLAPLGEVAEPWQLLRRRRLAATAALLLLAARRIVLANLRLSRLIWDPRLRLRDGPLRSGMIIVPTQARSAGQLTAVGLITSVIVDNQLTDLDPSRAELQYHAVEVPDGGTGQAGSGTGQAGSGTERAAGGTGQAAGGTGQAGSGTGQAGSGTERAVGGTGQAGAGSGRAREQINGPVERLLAAFDDGQRQCPASTWPS
jgi:multicomponent Na+:H+ antiporter subunit E